MGLDATLMVIARSEYRKYPRAKPVAVAQFDINRGWLALDLAFQTLPAPLGLALRGDRPTVEEFEDEWDAYDAFVSLELVRKISRALARVTDDELITALQSVGYAQRKREHAEHFAAFKELKAAYQTAAKHNAYLRIFIC
jgi:hypothetical protein